MNPTDVRGVVDQAALHALRRDASGAQVPGVVAAALRSFGVDLVDAPKALSKMAERSLERLARQKQIRKRGKTYQLLEVAHE